MCVLPPQQAQSGAPGGDSHQRVPTSPRDQPSCRSVHVQQLFAIHLHAIIITIPLLIWIFFSFSSRVHILNLNNYVLMFTLVIEKNK